MQDICSDDISKQTAHINTARLASVSSSELWLKLRKSCFCVLTQNALWSLLRADCGALSWTVAQRALAHHIGGLRGLDLGPGLTLKGATSKSFDPKSVLNWGSIRSQPNLFVTIHKDWSLDWGKWKFVSHVSSPLLAFWILMSSLAPEETASGGREGPRWEKKAKSLIEKEQEGLKIKRNALDVHVAMCKAINGPSCVLKDGCESRTGTANEIPSGFYVVCVRVYACRPIAPLSQNIPLRCPPSPGEHAHT